MQTQTQMQTQMQTQKQNPATGTDTAANGNSKGNSNNSGKPKGQSKYTPKPCMLVVGRPQGGQADPYAYTYTFRIEAQHPSKKQARKQRDCMMAEHPDWIYLVLDKTAPLHRTFAALADSNGNSNSNSNGHSNSKGNSNGHSNSKGNSNGHSNSQPMAALAAALNNALRSGGKL